MLDFLACVFLLIYYISYPLFFNPSNLTMTGKTELP